MTFNILSMKTTKILISNLKLKIKCAIFFIQQFFSAVFIKRFMCWKCCNSSLRFDRQGPESRYIYNSSGLKFCNAARKDLPTMEARSFKNLTQNFGEIFQPYLSLTRRLYGSWGKFKTKRTNVGHHVQGTAERDKKPSLEMQNEGRKIVQGTLGKKNVQKNKKEFTDLHTWKSRTQQ